MRIALFILIPIVVIAAIGGFIAWKILGLKQKLVVELETALHATAQIGALNLDIGKGELLASNISLQNQRPEAPWDNAVIEQAVIHFHFSDVFSSSMPLQVELNGWKATLHTGTAGPLPVSSDATPPAGEAFPPPVDASVPSWAKVTAVAATAGEVAIRLTSADTMTIHGVSFHADTPGGADWTTQLQVNSIAAGTFNTGTGSVSLHSDDKTIDFSNLMVHCGDGQVTGAGSADVIESPHRMKASFTAANVPITMLVATRWQVKLSGNVSGNLDYEGDDNAATATGKISVSGGKFNLFPWLGKATMLVGLPDVGDTQVDQATADYTWKNHVLTLQDIDVRKQDVFRLGGQASIAADSTIDGHLKLGLPAAAVGKWPKLQTEIFSVVQDDYDWTDVHVTGTPENPQEDLSPRLLSFTAEQGSQLLQQTKDKATNLINDLFK